MDITDVTDRPQPLLGELQLVLLGAILLAGPDSTTKGIYETARDLAVNKEFTKHAVQIALMRMQKRNLVKAVRVTGDKQGFGDLVALARLKGGGRWAQYKLTSAGRVCLKDSLQQYLRLWQSINAAL